jgi:hypothetical protein
MDDHVGPERFGREVIDAAGAVRDVLRADKVLDQLPCYLGMDCRPLLTARRIG